MKPETRACVAYIAGRLMSDVEFSSVYDQRSAKHFNFSGSVSHSGVDISLESPGTPFGWRVRSERISEDDGTYDFLLDNEPTMKPVELTVDENGRFRGMDRDPQHRFRSFSGFVQNDLIVIDDYDPTCGNTMSQDEDNYDPRYIYSK
jgi:hypothetical protein